jgi:hypothetical protein
VDIETLHLYLGWGARIFRKACPRLKACPVPLGGMPGHGKFTVTLKYIYVFAIFWKKKKESNVREVPIVHLRVQGFQPAYPAGWDPRVCKSDRLNVDILQFSFIKFGHILQIPLKWSVIFLQFWTSTGYFSNSTGSLVTNCRFSPVIDAPMCPPPLFMAPRHAPGACPGHVPLGACLWGTCPPPYLYSSFTLTYPWSGHIYLSLYLFIILLFLLQ